jgi:hypothetical protein
MTYRNRALLDIAHEAPCCLQIMEVCEGGKYPSVPCHSDMLRHGRGTGHKSHDCYAVPGCPACHAAFSRKHLGRDGYDSVWCLAFERYIGWLWAEGKIGVK